MSLPKSDCCGSFVGEHHEWTIKKGVKKPKGLRDYELTERIPYCYKCGRFQPTKPTKGE
jgi:hypothetical protein